MAAEEAKAAEDMASFSAALEGYKNIGDYLSPKVRNFCALL
ncbi:MAG: hypothetical protein P8N70_01365 [Akkermansiaceae bacterium]|nr:hypothetical protein [Akkermansiaceae bacterium]